MEQCLRVLDGIQPATREGWTEACRKDIESRGAHCLGGDIEVAIDECIREWVVRVERNPDETNESVVYRLASSLEDVLVRVGAIYARNLALNAADKAQWEGIRERPPVYVIRAPASISPAMKEHLMELLKELGAGFIIPDTVTIEEF